MRCTLMTLGLLLATVGISDAQDAAGDLTGGLGVGSGIGAANGLGAASGLGTGSALDVGSGLGAGNGLSTGGGLGVGTTGGIDLSTSGGLGIGNGTRIGVEGGLSNGLNLRVPGVASGLLPGIGVRTGTGAGANVDAPGIDLSGSLDGATHVRARQRRTMRPENRQSPPAGYAGGNITAETRSLLQADLSLATRLAQIDRLRDHAVAAGDFEMLARADVLENQARLQHAQRVEAMASAFAQSGVDGSSQHRAQMGQQAAFVTESATTATRNGFNSTTEFGATAAARAENGAVMTGRQISAFPASNARFEGATTTRTTGQSIQPAGFERDATLNGSAESQSRLSGQTGIRPNISSAQVRGESRSHAAADATTAAPSSSQTSGTSAPPNSGSESANQ